MKNNKKVIITLLALIFIGATTTYAAISWRGSQNVTNVHTNLNLIQEKLTRLENSEGDHKQELREIQILLEQEKALREQKERELADKQKEIENKQKEIGEKVSEIEQKNQQLQVKEDELNQALRDIQEIERITGEMAR